MPGFHGSGLYSQLRVSSSAIEKQIMMPSQKKAPTITILVRPGLYFTCMKNRTTRQHLRYRDGKRDHRVPPAQVNVGHPRRESRANQQSEENSHIGRNRNHVREYAPACSP